MHPDIIYNRAMLSTHTLIAGASGSGKSVLLNGAICYAYRTYAQSFKLVCIDLKGVELESYRKSKQCISYAYTLEQSIKALEEVSAEMERRFHYMRRNNLKHYNGVIIYVIIDELADLMLMAKKKVVPLLQHIGQLGRAANIKMVVATQCPLASKVIPTEIKVNFDCICGLRTRSAQDSRNILGLKGCEDLPRYGYCYLDTPELMRPIKIEVPNCTDDYIQQIVKNYG